jgi:FkbM family methyltransferase
VNAQSDRRGTMSGSARQGFARSAGQRVSARVGRLGTRTAGALLSDRQFAWSVAQAHRLFEPEMGQMSRMCPLGGTAIDVGSWYGPWTRQLASRATRVISIEPNPAVADVLRRTVPRNVEVLELAVSDSTGAGVLHLPARNRGGEGVGTLTEDGHRWEVKVPVRVTQLDDLITADVRFIKVDAEGHELAVLRGAARLLERDRPVVVVELEHRFGHVQQVVRFMGDRGYVGRVLVDRRWIPLQEFDLAAHQRDHRSEGERPYHERIVRTLAGHRYINNVVFESPTRSTSRPEAGGGLDDVAVIIPALNESDNLRRLIPALRERLGCGSQIIVVDDGSSDDTAAVAERLLSSMPQSPVVRQPWNCGKGAAIRAGAAHVVTSRVVFLDADGSTDLCDLEPLVAKLDVADVAIGSRRMPGAVTRRPSLRRRLMSDSFQWWARRVGGADGDGHALSDTQCGFKAFRTDALLTLTSVQQVRRFAFDVEMLLIAQRLGLRVAEVPVRWTDADRSTVRPIADSVRMAIDVLGCRFRLRRNVSSLSEAWLRAPIGRNNTRTNAVAQHRHASDAPPRYSETLDSRHSEDVGTERSAQLESAPSPFGIIVDLSDPPRSNGVRSGDRIEAASNSGAAS